jgi:hypothetical protein
MSLQYIAASPVAEDIGPATVGRGARRKLVYRSNRLRVVLSFELNEFERDESPATLSTTGIEYQPRPTDASLAIMRYGLASTTLYLSGDRYQS